MSAKSQLLEKTNTKLKEPKRYKVVIYNDDFTPMDFVVDILIDIFHKNYKEAYDLMMQVHKGTKAIAGIYSYDIAKTKTELVINMAREEGYPFRVEVEE